MVKSTTNELIPASVVQNKSVFKLYRDVVDTMISGAGSFAAILHRHRSADRLRKTVFVLAGCTEDMLAAFRATVDTGRNSPRHVADASDKFLLAIGTYKDSASGRPCRNFAGGVIVFVAPHSSDLWTLGNQIVDARDNLATCTNRATGVAVAYRFNNTVDGSRELLPAVGANEQHFFVTVCRYLAGSVSILAAPHIGDFRALSFQIVDTGNHLAVRARRATGVAAIHRMDDIVNRSLKLLLAVRADE